MGYLLPVFMIGIFYFLLILPQQRKQKQWRAMLGNLKTGDRVTTSGGIKGTIVALREDNIHLRVPPDNIRLEVARSAIVSVVTGEEVQKAS
jgi:preprotein translocase subunit YajC